MNTPLPDLLEAREWFVVYQDGTWASDAEVQWDEISHWEAVGSEKLAMLSQPAASLTAVVGRNTHTLRAPDRETTRFFRHYRARSNLMNGYSEIYHAIGYIWEHGQVTLEIDQRTGNTQLRVESNA